MAHRANLDELIDGHFDAVYSYVAFRLAPHVEPAADITQDVFAAAVAKPPTREAARAWLLRVARNKVADHYRRRGRESQATSESPAPIGDAATERRERATEVAHALRRIDSEQAALLEDKYLREMTVAQIARERDTTEKAVESALTRAREAFRAAMHDIEPIPGAPR